MKLERKFNALSALLEDDNADLKLTDFEDYATKKTAVGVLKIDDPDTVIAIDLTVNENKNLKVTIKDRYEESDAFEISETIQNLTTGTLSKTFLIGPLETYYHGDDGSVNIELSTTTTTYNIDDVTSKVNVFKIEL
ncbi:MAG: hypothetical protein WBH38_05315 [Defluviitoga tunisiensis]